MLHTSLTCSIMEPQVGFKGPTVGKRQRFPVPPTGRAVSTGHAGGPMGPSPSLHMLLAAPQPQIHTDAVSRSGPHSYLKVEVTLTHRQISGGRLGGVASCPGTHSRTARMRTASTQCRVPTQGVKARGTEVQMATFQGRVQVLETGSGLRGRTEAARSWSHRQSCPGVGRQQGPGRQESRVKDPTPLLPCWPQRALRMLENTGDSRPRGKGKGGMRQCFPQLENGQICPGSWSLARPDVASPRHIPPASSWAQGISQCLLMLPSGNQFPERPWTPLLHTADIPEDGRVISIKPHSHHMLQDKEQ